MIPYNTDAPIYHWPIATVGLIVVNTLLFLVVPRYLVDFEPSQFDPTVVQEAVERPTAMLSLEYGRGIKPWQWLTSNFMHANFMHLLFNMVALWAFGLVVEGKVGLLRFLGMFVGIGVVQSGLEQLLMCIYGEGGSLGASAAIFGILGIAVVWAPKNEFEVLYAFGFRFGTFEIPIMLYGLLQFASEVFSVAMGQFGVSSGVLHLMGFAIGLAVGFVWLVRGWVDCEGWDIVSVMKGTEGRDFESERLEREAADLVNSTYGTRSESPARMPRAAVATSQAPMAAPAKVESSKAVSSKTATSKTASSKGGEKSDAPAIPVVPRSFFAPPPPNADDFADLFMPEVARDEETPEAKLYGLIERGDHKGAVRLLIELRKSGALQLPQGHLAKLIRDLVAADDLGNAIPLMAEHIKRFEENRSALQMNLAKILVKKGRPEKALAVLQQIDPTGLDTQAGENVRMLVEYVENQVRANVK